MAWCPGGRWALLGCTVCPGFEFEDYETATCEELCAGWPAFGELIRQLTRTVIPFFCVDAVCEVPYGSYPGNMPYEYFSDEQHLKLWLEAEEDLERFQKFLQDYLVRNARQLGMAGKLLFPIPERGLAERLYRVKAKTVIVWGESDRMIPPVYGPAFQAAIAGSTLVNVSEAGHMVITEKPKEVARAVETVA